MKKFLQVFFIVLGVVFFVLILAGIYLYVADPFEIKPFIKSLTSQTASTKKQTGTNTVDKNPLLTPTQEQTLEKIGIDPATLPTQITPAMETCFYSKLGDKRTNEIKNGSTPTTADYLVARSCF
ncbi:MAG: hypothetical protein ACD_72C00310G0001 [uncultured bacterium]|nr:MAG: hypothetical protein ACD_72C00310G0001 [uncultured bacterium]